MWYTSTPLFFLVLESIAVSVPPAAQIKIETRMKRRVQRAPLGPDLMTWPSGHATCYGGPRPEPFPKAFLNFNPQGEYCYSKEAKLAMRPALAHGAVHGR